MVATGEQAGGPPAPAVLVRDLSYKTMFGTPILSGINMDLPPGSRCLLCGANGAGKTTLLSVLAGKFMVPESAVRLLGRPAFHDLTLVSSGDVSYLGTQKERLIKLLGIDLNWEMLSCSDGQRRRVQIAMGLMRPYQVLLLDEITVDMDVLGRLDLLQFFQECTTRNATIVYATHIFDGLEHWPTHVAYMEGGSMVRFGACASPFANLPSRHMAFYH
ncbi:hypothetical protein QBZ16_002426 [Prototheca wickerhamii]|uniref:ABC transporter domain-containing protein n=1 Tax=Prototheca wickerhamii TaxID=3111 RepID=A0AAD9IND9_PROWI|nr:hypothetical protein QBZ16_002426 [Prototheca wickerhamii]